MNLYNEPDSIWPRLSSDVPVASLREARRLLRDNHIPYDEARMQAYTVKSIVGEVASKLGYETYKEIRGDKGLTMDDLPGDICEHIRRAAEASLPSASSSLESVDIKGQDNDKDKDKDKDRDKDSDWVVFEEICLRFGRGVIEGSGFACLQDLKDYSIGYLTRADDPSVGLTALKIEIIRDLNLSNVKAQQLATRLQQIFVDKK